MAEPRTERGPAREKPQLIADELRSLIVGGHLSEGDSLGHEPDLVERFGVSRPSLREALRILEAEGLITVVRGALGRRRGARAQRADDGPDRRARAAGPQRPAGRRATTPAACSSPRRRPPWPGRRGAGRPAGSSSALIDEQERRLDDPDAFAVANARFHERLVALAGNQTLTIVAEMLNEIVSRAVTAVAQSAADRRSRIETRRRGIRSQRRLVELIAEGDAAGAEEHWRAHMAVVGRVLLGQQATTVVDLLDHY